MNEEQITRYMISKKYIEDKYICWDFVMDVYKDLFDIELPEYPVDEVQAKFKIQLTSNIRHIKVEPVDSSEGDIIVFSLFTNQHAGVMINNKSFIHLSKSGVEVKDIKNLIGNYTIYRIIK